MDSAGDRRQRKAEWVRGAMGAHEGALVRYASRIVGMERARDVVQETFLRLWQADRDKVGDHLVEWLYTVCRNRALDIIRKESRMTSSPSEVERASEPDGTPAPDEQAARRESLGQVLEAMERLPASQQEVIRLKFQSGLTYREISRITGRSVTNVGYLIHVGLKKVKARLQPVTDLGRPAALRRVQ